MAITYDEFVRSLTDCGLMEADEVQAFIDLLPLENRPRTAEALAKEMFRKGRLTKFQAQAIYQGKTRGLVVGNYVVEDKLGQGGMGAVYKARHRRMDRIVALKMLPSSATRSPEAVQRFQREVRAAAKLAHPNIVTAFDADESRGVYFLVMEYVEGQDLHALAKGSGVLSVPRAMDYLLQAAKGLEYAHQQKIIHRDIKPANLLLDKQGTVKVLDMGLARIEETVAGTNAAEEGLTQTGQVMGTLDYMPPEQAQDTGAVDARADIYSLGCTLHYLLTGRSPYSGGTIGQKIVAHREAPIPSLRRLRDDVPESLDLVFRKMLAKRPEDRQQTMTEVIRALQSCTLPEGPVAATPFSSSSGGYAETVDFLQEGTKPTEDSSPLDELFQGESVQLSQRLLAPSRRFAVRWTKQKQALLAGVAGAVLLLLLAWIIVKWIPPVPSTNEIGDTGMVANKQMAEPLPALTGTPTTDPAEPPANPGQTAPPLAIAPFDANTARQHQEAWNRHLGVPTEVTNSIGMSLVLIPPGEFQMGSTPEEIEWATEEERKKPSGDPWYMERLSATAPQHLVRITKPFYLAKYPVTQAMYEQVMGNNPSAFVEKQRDASTFDPPLNEIENRVEAARKVAGKDTRGHPVETVEWADAIEFCRRLSSLPAEQAARRSYRLPTEAEWEYACRAGTTSKWYSGDDDAQLANVAWYRENSNLMTQPVGWKTPNAWGLYDMHGNVHQWCADYFAADYYRRSPESDPLGPNLGVCRVLRGGNWRCLPPSCRSAFRCFFPPNPANFVMGFRVALTLASQSGAP